MLGKRKIKTLSGDAAEQFTDKAAGKIIDAIVFLQNRFARFMHCQTRHFSVITWKLVILFIAVAWCGLSSYFISTAFIKHPAIRINTSRIEQIKTVPSDSLQLMEEIYKKDKKIP